MSSQQGQKAFIFFILASFLASVSCQLHFYTACGTSGNFTVNSAYQTNLNTLFPSLSLNVDDNGFYNTSVGENSNTVYGTVLCRTDLQLDQCRLCVQNITNNLLRSCPNQVEAVCWTYFCMVRYSNVSMFRTLTTSPEMVGTENRNVTTIPSQFRSDLDTLLESLYAPAAYGGNLMKVAVGNRSTSGVGETIYALVQCTPDLSPENCNNCLREASQRLPTCCDTRIWATIYRPSCNVRYELLSFYNESRLNEVVGASMPNAPSGNDNNNNTSRIIIILVSVGAGATFAVIVGFLLRKRIKQRPKKEFHINEDEDEDEENINMAESLQYDFDKIKAATNDFSSANKLGQGGFGAVYRGVLHNGKEIAVKRLSKDSCQGNLEFKNEVTLLAKLQHRNLVRLLGFSLVGNEKLLVYEYLRNASLDHFIFDTRSSNLDWDLRYKIIGGIAKGLLYLHEDSRLRIIHRDLKASNILLDEEMNPKIADFGTARLFVPDQTQADTRRIVGTYGYMSPEYAMHGQCSVKLDVFSFGILVLEIISGQRNNNYRNHENVVDLLISSAWKYWRNGTAADLVDSSLKVGSGLPPDILRCIHISLLCVQENPVDRPTMASVLLMLSSSSITLPLPSKPAYFMASDNDPEDSITRDLENTITHGSSSSNEMTITLLDAR